MTEHAQTAIHGCTSRWPRPLCRTSRPAGRVRYIDDLALLPMLRDSDMVMCRTNEPLMSPALRLTGDGVKAIVRGRDIGASLVSLAHRLEAPTMREMYANLNRYAEQELRHLQDRNASELVVGAFQDKIDTLAATLDACRAPGEVAGHIDRIFSDQVGGVVFSTVHRAKGLEAERVFILRPDLMPHQRARQAWEQQHERNIEYVALTRSKAELCFIRESE